MMNKKIFLSSVITKAEDDDDGGLRIKGLASTDGVDRVGDVISLNAWKGGLSDFKNNPILLFNHNYDTPIGRADVVEVQDKGLYIEGRISPAAGEKVIGLIKDGVLGTFSVGFIPKEIEYIQESDGFLIKQAELLEVSVVSVPANAEATFSVAKQLNDTQINAIKTGDEPNAVDNSTTARKDAEGGPESQSGKFKMDEEELKAFIAKSISEGFSEKSAEEKAAEEKAKREAEEKARREEETKNIVSSVVTSVTNNSEKLVSDLEKRFDERFGKVDTLDEVVGDLKGEVEKYGEQIMQDRNAKRLFASGSESSWDKAFAKDIDDAFILSRAAAGRNKEPNWDTKFAKEVFEKVNNHSGVDVSSADFEQIVSTRIEEDIQNQLVLAPLFNEVRLNSATQILPILPDAGYAEFTTNQTASGSSPRGNLAERGDSYGTYGGVTLTEKTLSTKKLISRTYLGNETEEDAILPILPLIRRSMVRSHVRSVEAATLLGGSVDSPITGEYNGLVKKAVDASNTTQVGGTFSAFSATAATLLGARKSMGKYGVRADDIVYVVNQQSWFELLEDPEYQDVQLVGQDMATKRTGMVGVIFGTPVLLCDEFASPAVDKYFAVAINVSNFIVPRLRGVTLESDYETGDQRTVLVASQRLGFEDIIEGSSAVWALQYPSA